MEATRENVIKLGIQKGYNINEINNALASGGFESFNPIQEVGSNIVKNLQQFGRDFKTATGAVVQPIMASAQDIGKAQTLQEKGVKIKEAFNKAVNDPTLRRVTSGALVGGSAGSIIPGLGTVGGAVLGGTAGLVGGPKNLADAFLSTYNTSIDKLLNKQTTIGDIKAGILENPLYAGLDVLSLGGASALGKAGRVIGQSIPKSAPLALQQVLPSPELREFNRGITQNLVASRAKQAEVFRAYNALDSMPLANRTEIVKNITMNTGKLNKDEMAIAKAIKEDLKLNEQEAIKRGFIDSKFAKDNAVSQYVLAKASDEIPGLLHEDIMAMLEKRNIRKEFMDFLIDENSFKKIDDLIEEGKKLYDDNNISFLTQALAPSRDPFGRVIASDIAKTGEGYFGTNRVIGRTSAEELGNVLDQSIYHQLSQIGKASEASDVVNEMLKQIKAKKVGTDIPDLLSNKVPFSTEMFNQSIKNAVSKGSKVDIAKALRDAMVSTDGSYLVDKIYLDALNNAFKPSKLGELRKVSSAFKKAVLANPHWVLLNRIGNMTNNFMGGVTLGDYQLAYKLRNIIPNKLKQQTAFNSYVGSGVEELGRAGKYNVFKQPINRLVRSINKIKSSNKSLSDVGQFLGDAYSSISDLTANPLFRLESTLERTDRYANFIRQAKREALLTGKKVEDVIKKSNTDDGLFNKLNTNVNKDLGDYLGKNYAIPSGVYDVLGEVVPFYRFLTQTGRTTLHQLANHPLAFNAMAVAPAKAGSSLADYILKEYDLDPEQYKGGVPYKKTPWGDVRTVGIEPLPVQAVSGNLAGILTGKGLGDITSPLVTMGGDIVNYKRGGKYTPTSPRLTQLKLTNPREAENYQPTPSEFYKYALNQLLSTTFNPYRWATMYGPEILATVKGEGLQSRYATDPFVINPLSYKRTTPTELIGKWASIQTESNYPRRKQKISKKDLRGAARNRARLNQMINYEG